MFVSSSSDLNATNLFFRWEMQKKTKKNMFSQKTAWFLTDVRQNQRVSQHDAVCLTLNRLQWPQSSPETVLRLFIFKGEFTVTALILKLLVLGNAQKENFLIYMLLLWRWLHFSLSGGFDQTTLVISLSACCVCVLQTSHCNFTRTLCKTSAASFCLWCSGHSFSFVVAMRQIDMNVSEAFTIQRANAEKKLLSIRN